MRWPSIKGGFIAILQRQLLPFRPAWTRHSKVHATCTSTLRGGSQGKEDVDGPVADASEAIELL